MATMWQDIRYGLRMLAKNPGFTVVVIVILAVGIGANTAVFSIVNAVMLRPLPYEDADRIVCMYNHSQWGDFPPPHGGFLLCREDNPVFGQMTACGPMRAEVSGIENARRVRATAVSSEFFSFVRAKPLLGRVFRAEEEQPGKDLVIVVSHSFWQNDLGGTDAAIGKTVGVDDKNYTVVGVMPRDFKPIFGEPTTFWIPLVFSVPDPALPLGYAVFVYARLKEGVTLEQARAFMPALAERFKRADPQGEDYNLAIQRPLDKQLEGKRTLPLLLLGAAGFILLIACSNVANLFLVRATIRQRELAMRAALGASRGRILRQMITEGLLLSAAGGAVGLLMTVWTLQGLVGLCPRDIPRLDETRVDLPVLAFTLGISVLTGLLFGAMPAWKASGTRMAEMLQEGVMRPTIGRRGRRVHSGLVVAQVGLSLILLIGAGLLIRSLIALQRLDLGFRPKNVLAMTVVLPADKYAEPARCQAFFEGLLPRVRALPHVRSAGLSLSELGLGFAGYAAARISIAGRDPVPTEEQDVALLSVVTPGFFQALGVPLLRGRTFTEEDLVTETSHIVIDEHLARRHFGDVNPIGRRIDFPDSHHIVIGVVDTVKDFEHLEQAYSTIYLPMTAEHWAEQVVFVVRSDGDPLRLVDAITAQAADLETDKITWRIETVEARLAGMLRPRRVNMILLSLFAGIALILAMVGVYGLLQYNATQQTRDMAIRMALGARKKDVLTAMVRQGLTLTLIGVVVGLAGAIALTRLLSSLLYGVTPTDPLTLTVVSLVLIAVALLASYLPARRAAKVDPMVALRYE
ncbi:ABC transporter permease [Anaerobaca lacustris]|uniref:ABC transporter permease n=1 Tax=Anaerobaca lacustris TaxID=3044600 RepID=A0AAW6TYX0_9BACT|nr:ABC transporter permease [Sedimentisphaerales bacterium M17dextr]